MRPKPNVFEAVRRRDRGLCFSCGKPGEEIHHIVSRSLFTKGDKSRDEERNLCLLCRKCHSESHCLNARRKLIQAMEKRHGYAYEDGRFRQYVS